MTNLHEWESSIQWLGICDGCSNLTWVTTGISTDRDLCEVCFQ